MSADLPEPDPKVSPVPREPEPHAPGNAAPEPDDDGPEPPPPGVGVMAALRWLILVAAALAAAYAWWSYRHVDPIVEHAPKYRCPMHPQITSTDPGECPICHMALEPIPEQHDAPAVYRCPMHPQIQQDTPGTCPICKMDLERVAPEQPVTVYRCPMHPQIQQDTPGACPICKMDLEPVQLAPEDAASSDMPPGTAPLTLGLDRLQAIGARIVVAEEREFAPTLRSAALTEFSEDGAARVHVRADGFIERIVVDQTGVRVRKGQTLAEYYSPEIYQAQVELLAARGWSGGQALAAARLRLELLGLSAAAIDAVLKTGKPDRTTAITAPASGTVVARNAVLGAFVRPDEPLYELREDRTLYLVAELPAARAAAIGVGTRGHVRFARDSGPARELAVDLVYPAVERDSRAVRVRLPLPNADRELVAGLPAVVEFALPPVRGVAVPRDAIVDAGLTPHVFIDRGGGRLAPRHVVLGERDDAFVLVREGVRAGERVVAGATFLVDAESRLRAALVPAAPHDMSHTP